MHRTTVEAGWHGDWVVKFRHDSDKYEAARNGDVAEQNRIIRKFKAIASKEHGRELTAIIGWDDKPFDIHPARRAPSAKRSTASKPRKKPVVNAPTGECNCGEPLGRKECTQCDLGIHCHEPENGCYLRPGGVR